MGGADDGGDVGDGDDVRDDGGVGDGGDVGDDDRGSEGGTVAVERGDGVEDGFRGGTRPDDSVALRLGQSLLAVVAALVAGAALAPWAGRLGLALGVAPESPEFVAVRSAGQFVGFALAMVVFLAYANDRDLVSLRRPTRHEAGLVPVAAGGLVLAQFALVLVLQAVGIGVATNRALTPGQDAPRYFLYMVAVSILLVGPAEELVFRGVVQGELRKALSAPPAIGLAAFLFGSLHFVAGTGTIVEQTAYVLVATLLALPLGYLYEATGNLTVPAVTHGLYNAVLYLVQYADATGFV
ncbi:CPBP family intramembrane glutamic endopeptidase [Halorarum salinum]|uniref:CPBP family intramembrane metalloprotease n=1 Tax=Halorarum salinum TaxID=2743089 RepID=A0A7D5QG95_9EURY|nr:type II CAAX endopeptidase family protein [Halobaculum salinum]QLG61304.1 CPBP family intramembrane metalloprotease [Halobaculum salinum]